MENAANKSASGRSDFQKYGIAVVMLVVLCGLAATGRAKISDNLEKESTLAAGKKIALVSPEEFQPIRADIINKEPSKFTIDVENLANLSADEEAPVFAVYTASSLPDQCGDFRELELHYKKPSEYKRQFDLSGHKEVLEAIDSYGCVVMKNIPPRG